MAVKTTQPYIQHDFYFIIGLLLISSTLTITGCSGDESSSPPQYLSARRTEE